MTVAPEQAFTELGLNPNMSSMANIIQAQPVGRRSSIEALNANDYVGTKARTTADSFLSGQTRTLSAQRYQPQVAGINEARMNLQEMFNQSQETPSAQNQLRLSEAYGRFDALARIAYGSDYQDQNADGKQNQLNARPGFSPQAKAANIASAVQNFFSKLRNQPDPGLRASNGKGIS